MTLGSKQEFHEAWRDLKEHFIRQIAQKYYGVTLSDMDIRGYKVDDKEIIKVLNEIRQKNIFRSIFFRTQRKIHSLLK
jgi:hypothetical protein